MSTWHQCTGEPPRASSVMTPDTEAKVPGSDLVLENPDDAKYFFIDEHVERVYPVEPDLSVPPGCVPVKRVSREELSEMYQEKPYSELDLSQVEGDGGWVPLSVRTGTQSYAEWKAGDVSPPLPLVGTPAEPTAPEARCPECGEKLYDSLRSSRPRTLKYASIEYRWACGRAGCSGSEPYLRDREVWRRWGDTDKAAGTYWALDGEGKALTWRTISYFSDGEWVLGPLQEPHAPAGVG